MNTILKINTDKFSKLALEILTSGLSLQFRATGQSMRPNILDGDIITVQPLNKRGLKIGDIIMHRTANSESLAVHRIIRMTRCGKNKHIFYTRGDAFGDVAHPVEKADILGRAVMVDHCGRITRLGTSQERLKGMLWVYRQSLRHRYHKFIAKK